MDEDLELTCGVAAGDRVKQDDSSITHKYKYNNGHLQQNFAIVVFTSMTFAARSSWSFLYIVLDSSQSVDNANSN